MKTGLLKEMKYDSLKVVIYKNNEEVGKAAAEEAAKAIKIAIDNKKIANIMIATGNSQLSFLKELREINGISWGAVNIFHMDEYLDLPAGHSASFLHYLQKNFLSYINGYTFFPVPGHSQNVENACKGYEYLLRAHPLDICCMGIGENGHIAFNEPSIANFNDPVWVKVVKLEEESRRQQVGEGYFKSLKNVPTQAISVTIPGLLAAKKILCIVPEKRKAKAVFRTLNEPININCPATILRKTSWATLYLDIDSASMILNQEALWE